MAGATTGRAAGRPQSRASSPGGAQGGDPSRPAAAVRGRMSGVTAPLSSAARHNGVGTRALDVVIRPGVAVAVGLGLVGAFLAHMVLTVPVRAPALTRGEAVRHLPGAAGALLIVVAVDTLFVAGTL